MVQSSHILFLNIHIYKKFKNIYIVIMYVITIAYSGTKIMLNPPGKFKDQYKKISTNSDNHHQSYFYKRPYRIVAVAL